MYENMKSRSQLNTENNVGEPNIKESDLTLSDISEPILHQPKPSLIHQFIKIFLYCLKTKNYYWKYKPPKSRKDLTLHVSITQKYHKMDCIMTREALLYILIH